MACMRTVVVSVVTPYVHAEARLRLRQKTPQLAESGKAGIVSVVIPAFDEERRIERTLDETVAHLEGRKKRKGREGRGAEQQATMLDYEILVVNDGSRDDTEGWCLCGPLYLQHVEQAYLLRVASGQRLTQSHVSPSPAAGCVNRYAAAHPHVRLCNINQPMNMGKGAAVRRVHHHTHTDWPHLATSSAPLALVEIAASC